MALLWTVLALIRSRRKQLRGQLIGPAQVFYNWGVTINSTQFDNKQLVSQMQAWARELGLSQLGVSGVDLSSAEAGLSAWLSRGFHGDMAYMQSHGLKRARSAELVPGTLSVITARIDYLPSDTPEGWPTLELDRLQHPTEGIVSVYARGAVDSASWIRGAVPGPADFAHTAKLTTSRT